ncbi:MAG: acyltransferase family protein [Lachnospiraceae bacterium]|nr:acyltransferase family protein [Lachnospiraceae bacterium]
MKINKHLLQFLAALWILAFHLWISVTGTVGEAFLVRIGYVGVDLFFFVSAFSLADKELRYGEFLKNRFSLIYLKFLIFTAAAALYKSWGLTKFLKTAFFISFFERGGGSFLWFAPAILLFYVLYPLFLKWNWKYKVPAVLALWLLLSILLEGVFGYTKVFIFTNRIPVILAGYVLKRHSIKKQLYLPSLALGLVLLYFYGFTIKCNIPVRDSFYVLAIPVVVGLAGISGYVKQCGFVTMTAGATFEMYAVQMIWGAELVRLFYRTTGSPLAANLLVFLSVVGCSVVLSKVFSQVRKLLI